VRAISHGSDYNIHYNVLADDVSTILTKTGTTLSKLMHTT